MNARSNRFAAIAAPVAVADRAVIAINGIDGSGKTTFAVRLATALAAHGVGVLVLHVDDFRRPVHWTRPDRDEGTIYLEDYYDFGAIEACVAAFTAGELYASRPLYDERNDRGGGEAEVRFDGIAVVIVEGVFTLRLPSAARHYRVFLSASFDTARRRIIARRSPPWRTVDEFEARIARRYIPAQRRYLAETTPERSADVLVDNEDLEQPRLLRADIARLPAPLRQALVSVLP